MCKEIKDKYKCSKADGHIGNHQCEWEEKDSVTGKTLYWSTWW